MDEKTKLYVFAKKELALIFIFIIFTAICSFILGVKLGKQFSYESSGYQPGDIKKVEMLSGQEEVVEKVVSDYQKQVQVTDDVQKDGAIKDQSYAILKQKIDQEFSDDKKINSDISVDATNDVIDSMNESQVEEVEEKIGTDYSASSKKKFKRDEYSGKYTIQLGSHKSINDAEAFADGFRVRGYNPIINEVNLEGRGVWYRVSLGVFETVSSAKDYIVKEKSLFKGQDYVIAKFD